MTGYAHSIVGRAGAVRTSKFMCHVLKDCRDGVFIFVTHMLNVIIFRDVWRHGASLKLTIFDSLTFCHIFLHFVAQTPTPLINIMAANQAAINNYLQDTLGFPQTLAHALNAQGLDGFDILINLTDKDIKEMCTNVRNPGGTIPNPAFDAANPVPGVPATIPNPGVSMGLPHEKLLRQLCYYCAHMYKIQREFTDQGATLAKLTELWRFKEAIEEEDDDDIKFPDVLKTVENVRQRPSKTLTTILTGSMARMVSYWHMLLAKSSIYLMMPLIMGNLPLRRR
jgi:hypothetical protein